MCGTLSSATAQHQSYLGTLLLSIYEAYPDPSKGREKE